ncbi:MAG: CoA transferase [Chloroflexi bacterium]|nr:CoA transferase [Chloroflexota bacterium]
MKVLDLTQHVAGPYCTKLLADFGADVVKIEKPGEGDSARRLGPFPGDKPHPDKGGLFAHLNTNKRSVTLDLKSATGQSIFKEMVETADVVVESFRPGIMASFGLDYPVLSRVNPRLIMASISNFGQTGPYRDFRASDLVLAGMGGSQSGGGIIEREPLKIAQFVSQFMAGYYASVGVMGAFFAREWQGGTGQYLDLSLLELLISFGDGRFTHQVGYQFAKREEAREPQQGRIISSPPTGAYPCADGYVEWWGMGRWRQLSRMLGRPDLLTDPRFATEEARIANHDEVAVVLYSWMMERTRKQCWDEAVEADVICAPYNTVEELLQDPHINSRGFWADVEHPALGKTTLPGRPFVLTESPWELRRPAPLLGQHTAEVLGELGYGKEDLVRLSEAGVI